MILSPSSISTSTIFNRFLIDKTMIIFFCGFTIFYLLAVTPSLRRTGPRSSWSRSQSCVYTYPVVPDTYSALHQPCSTHLSSIHQLINQSVNQSINQSTNHILDSSVSLQFQIPTQLFTSFDPPTRLLSINQSINIILDHSITQS